MARVLVPKGLLEGVGSEGGRENDGKREKTLGQSLYLQVRAQGSSHQNVLKERKTPTKSHPGGPLRGQQGSYDLEAII